MLCLVCICLIISLALVLIKAKQETFESNERKLMNCMSCIKIILIAKDKPFVYSKPPIVYE